MKLIYRISLRVSVFLLALFALWGALFYFIIIDEINDETDDALEDYSEQIISRALAGEELPSKDSGTNNNYYINRVTEEYAKTTPSIRFSEDMIYIESKEETEPARILKTIFMDKDNVYHELTVLIPTIEKHDLKETILVWIVILYVSLLLVIVLINAWILRSSFKPLYVILDWLDNFRVNETPRPLDNETDVIEFRKLNQAVLDSARRNIDTYEQQKTFIGNASHELQTPLAVCKNRLELLSNDSDLSEKQLEEIFKTRQAIDSVIKLNKALLLLTKIENQQFPDEETINLNALVDRYLADYSEVYESLEITATKQDEGILTFEMNEALASALVGNLIKNAFVHNSSGGTIEIEITPSSLKVSNTGTRQALSPERIFDRFYQGNKKEGSLGLGLAIVRAITKVYDLNISYSYENDKHCFTVRKK